MRKSLQYPIGEFKEPKQVSLKEIEGWIEDIENTPEQLKLALEGLSEPLLDTSYRPGGWTVRQVVHHLADSHMNSYIRFKLALTEDRPTIKAYDEKTWAAFPDTKLPLSISINLLESLHERWVYLLKSMSMSDFEKTFFHPETNKEISLSTNVALYSWHGKHHIEHIKLVRVH
ncbi:YfiT family bacillithiol transferase [Bacillus sp. AFS040349]|uniref:YfiT family bacillithiol transferase n=1 Tax=Bacillus sp. AFS040349 TaxID=2033502 RepID=UPI000BFBE1B2|nr:bacillithiol transferase BstA [Bacillus sp. AFS040349]PGT82613.1 metal-dependent hydrolase [Bacillus sp. AFS040349]